MGKGGYLGGGTVIGPRAPDWFGRGDTTVIPVQGSPDVEGTPWSPVPSRHLTDEAQRQIDKTRGSIGALERDIIKARTFIATLQRDIVRTRMAIERLESYIANKQNDLVLERVKLSQLQREYGLPEA